MVSCLIPCQGIEIFFEQGSAVGGSYGTYLLQPVFGNWLFPRPLHRVDLSLPTPQVYLFQLMDLGLLDKFPEQDKESENSCSKSAMRRSEENEQSCLRYANIMHQEVIDIPISFHESFKAIEDHENGKIC